MISECHKSPTFDPQASADALFHFLQKNLGVSKFDVFSRLKDERLSQTLKESSIDKFHKLSTKQMKLTCENYKENFEKLKKASPAHVVVRNISG